MNNTQQPTLPTLQPGDSHMESLIAAAIQGHADTRDAMRWLVRQLVPATQPADVTDSMIREAFLTNGFTIKDGHSDLKPYVYAAARAILALRPQSTGETFDQWLKREMPAGAVSDMELGWNACAASFHPAAVPMTDGEILHQLSKVSDRIGSVTRLPKGWLEFARAIEEWHGITAQADLWCIHIPGPDEVHAAPSKEAAEHMAAKHNAVMATYYASGAPNLEFAPALESVRAVVIKWPHDQQSHADELREFDYASWGITAQAKKEKP